MRRVPPGAPIVSAAAMRDAEQRCFAAGVTQATLMTRAGEAVAREVRRLACERPILVLAGPGNNGGDAFVCARFLIDWRLDVTVAALGLPSKGVADDMRQRWQAPVAALSDTNPRAVLVDGLFGTGLSRPLAPEVTRALRRLADAAEMVIAIDLPSGIDTDTGRSIGTVGANVTVALGALKPAHLIGEGIALCGHVLLADIGVQVPQQWNTLSRPRVAAPPPDAHKFDRGLVVVVEGAMPGAGRLATRAALLGGAGYVIHAAADMPSGLPDAVVHRSVGSAGDLRALLDDKRVGCVAIGPGLGRGGDARALVEVILDASCPAVIDGDALHLVTPAQLAGRAAATVLTPHAGEFAALFGRADDKLAATLAAAKATGATIVHKGADTVVGYPDGRAVVAADASGWLSTAGSGDVLAGLTAARIAAGGCAEEAVWLHGRAAAIAGPAFSADMLANAIPAAIDACR